MSESTATLKLNVTTGQSAPALGALVQQTGFLGSVLKSTQAEADRLSAILSGTGGGGSGSGKSIVQSVKDVSTAINQSLEVFKKFGEGAKEAFAFADETIRLTAEMSRLNTAIPTKTLDQFRAATKGTVDDLTLLRTANVAMQGAFHLTAAGVDEVFRAATNLSQKGFGPTVEIFEKLDKAIRSQSVDGLKDYGISLENAGTKAATVSKILKALHEEANKKINVDPSVEAINKLENSVSNWWNGFKAQIGEVFGYIAQAIAAASDSIDKVGKRVGDAQDTSSAVNQHSARPEQAAALKFRQLRGRGYNPNGDPDELDFNVYNGQQQKDDDALFQALVILEKENQRLNDINKSNASSRSLASMALKQRGDIKGGQHLTAGKLEEKPYPITFGDRLKSALDRPGSFELGYQSREGAESSNPDTFQLTTGSDNLFTPQLSDDDNQDLFGGGVLGSSQFQQFLKSNDQESQLMDQLKDKTSLLGAGFSTLQSGISAAVEAAIDGSDGIARAFAKASSAALKSIAIESATRALYETALGFGELAWGSAPTAALHFKSAAVFTAAAVAAGVGAAALGALGGGSSSSAGSGGVASGGSGPSSQANNNGPSVVNVYISGAVTAGDYSKLGETVTKAVKLGQQTGRVRSGDNITVTWE